MEKEGKTNQKDLNSTQDVHGSCEGGAQVETQAHCAPKLWTQGATDHEVGSSGLGEGREGHRGRGRQGLSGLEDVEVKRDGGKRHDGRWKDRNEKIKGKQKSEINVK